MRKRCNNINNSPITIKYSPDMSFDMYSDSAASAIMYVHMTPNYNWCDISKSILLCDGVSPLHSLNDDNGYSKKYAVGLKINEFYIVYNVIFDDGSTLIVNTRVYVYVS